MKDLKSAFAAQKCSARIRGIDFLLSFDEWLSIWKKSKKLSLRGRGSGKYCMGRKGDSGPYSKDNVIIIKHEKNVSDGQSNRVRSENELKALSLRLKGNTLSKGIKRSEEYKKKMSIACSGRIRPKSHCEALSKAKKRYWAEIRAQREAGV